MSWTFKKDSNVLDMYSPPLSDLNTFILYSNSFSTRAFHDLNFSNTSHLYLKKCTHAFLEKSSMTVKEYLAPSMEVVLMGLHTSECTISNTLASLKFTFEIISKKIV